MPDLILSALRAVPGARSLRRYVLRSLLLVRDTPILPKITWHNALGGWLPLIPAPECNGTGLRFKKKLEIIQSYGVLVIVIARGDFHLNLKKQSKVGEPYQKDIIGGGSQPDSV